MIRLFPSPRRHHQYLLLMRLKHEESVADHLAMIGNWGLLGTISIMCMPMQLKTTSLIKSVAVQNLFLTVDCCIVLRQTCYLSYHLGFTQPFSLLDPSRLSTTSSRGGCPLILLWFRFGCSLCFSFPFRRWLWLGLDHRFLGDHSPMEYMGQEWEIIRFLYKQTQTIDCTTHHTVLARCSKLHDSRSLGRSQRTKPETREAAIKGGKNNMNT